MQQLYNNSNPPTSDKLTSVVLDFHSQRPIRGRLAQAEGLAEGGSVGAWMPP